MSAVTERLPFLERHADIIFSVKTFIAAMAALLIGFAADLPRPYWALATVYITSQPLAGATRSKALYRVIGTLVGAAASIVFVPALVNSPELLSLTIAAWVGLCLYVSLLDRTPRSYMFMLAGYTCALIAFPSVSQPAAIFDTAMARSQEIIVGILCATVVSTVLLPRSVGPAVAARVDGWLVGARKLCQDVLAGRGSDQAVRDLRLKLAGDAVDLDALADQLGFDRGSHRETVHWMRALRVRMLTFLPALSSLDDRIQALGPNLRRKHPQLATLLDDVAQWIGNDAFDREPAERLRERIAAQRPALTAASPWTEIIIASLLMRLRELVDISADCRILNQAIASGERPAGARLVFQPEAGVAPARYRDPGMALWSAAGAFVTILVCCAFWILTGWTDGATAPMMAAIGCSFYANTDDPSVGLRGFAKWTLVAMIIIATYLFAILPAITHVELLVVVLAPTFLVYGYLIARPATFFIGMLLAANTATMMALQETYSANFESFANSSVAFLVGMEMSVISIRLIRSVGSEWSVRRMMRRGWIAIAEAAERRGQRDRAVFAGVMLNRIGTLAPRLLALKDSELRKIDNLRELRVGLNIVDLRRARRHLLPRTLNAIDAMLDELALCFRKHDGSAMPQALLQRVDQAIAAAIDETGGGRTDALIGLVGIRRGLFPDAADYRPEIAPSLGSVAA